MDPLRLAQAHRLVMNMTSDIARSIQSECAASEAPPTRVAIELTKQWCETFAATVAVLEQIMKQKPTETRDDEIVAVVREIARASTALSASAIGVLVHCQVEIPELSDQLSH